MTTTIRIDRTNKKLSNLNIRIFLTRKKLGTVMNYLTRFWCEFSLVKIVWSEKIRVLDINFLSNVSDPNSTKTQILPLLSINDYIIMNHVIKISQDFFWGGGFKRCLPLFTWIYYQFRDYIAQKFHIYLRKLPSILVVIVLMCVLLLVIALSNLEIFTLNCVETAQDLA